jgi:2-polyprenyl-6-methoxyphenol hydroxylase-like FAD-dependent oxidoreductase
MDNRNVLISGASVAGPAVAYWLARHGFRATVVETSAGLRDGGYAVDLRAAAVEVTSRMGILDDIRRASTQMGDMWNVDSADRRLATLPAEIFGGEIEVLRGDLSEILYEQTKSSVDYIFDDSIAALVEDASGVQVTFESGRTGRFDLVIGADGLHSNTRRLAFGTESDFTEFLGYYLSIFSVPNKLNLDYTGHIYKTPGRIAAMYSARQNTEARALFAFSSPKLSYDHRDVGKQKELLTDAYAGETGWEVPWLLEQVNQAPDFYFDSTSQVHLDRYSRGRVVLLGDAAYCASPLSGQGTGLAIVGAYVLAGELAAAGGDHVAAFDRYERQMRGYVKACQQLAVSAGPQLVPPNPFQNWMINQSLRILPYTPWKGAITAPPRKAASAIELKTYEAAAV